MNAAILGRHNIGDESAAVEDLKNFWTAASNTTLYKDWVGGIIDGLILHGGLYNSEPLKTFIKD